VFVRHDLTSALSILRLIGIDYILVDLAGTGEQQTLQILDSSPQLMLLDKLGNLVVYETKVHGSLVSGWTDWAVYVGGLQVYLDLLKSEQNHTPLPIFSDSPFGTPGLVPIMERAQSVVYQALKNMNDIVLSMLMSSQTDGVVLNPASYATRWSPSGYWSPGYVSYAFQGAPPNYDRYPEGYQWEYGYRPEYGFLWTTAPNATTEIGSDISGTDDYYIIANILMSPAGGVLEITLDGQPWVLNTLSDYSVSWFSAHVREMRLESGHHKIGFKNIKGLNMINTITFVPKNTFIRYQQLAETILSQRALFGITTGIASDLKYGFEQSAVFNILCSQDYRLVMEFDNIWSGQAPAVFLNGTRMMLSEGTNYTAYSANLRLSQGVYLIKVTPQNLLANGDFSNYPNGWTPLHNDSFRLYKTSVIGDILRLEYNSMIPNWTRLVSDLVPVRSGERYLVAADMKWQNANASHIAILGYNDTSEHIVQIAQFASGTIGSGGWQSFETVLDIPDHIKWIAIALNAGWALTSNSGSAVTEFRNLEVYRYQQFEKLLIVSMNHANDTEKQVVIKNVSENGVHVRSYQGDISSDSSRFVLFTPEIYTSQNGLEIESGESSPVPVLYFFSGYIITGYIQGPSVKFEVRDPAVAQSNQRLSYALVIMLAAGVMGAKISLRSRRRSSHVAT
jgi:hypothetical protein